MQEKKKESKINISLSAVVSAVALLEPEGQTTFVICGTLVL